MKMDVVLINSPIQRYSKEYRPSYRTTAPIGLGILGTISRKSGFDTVIIDAEEKKMSVDEIAEDVNNLSPGVVGINMTSTNHKISLEILERIRAPCKIIGGPHATLRGERIEGDYLIVKGEAEDIFPSLLKSRKIGIYDAKVIEDLDTVPFIDRSLFGNDPYMIDGRLESTMSTSRGCLFNCVFCSVPVINGRKMRSRSLDNVLSEIDRLRAVHGVNSIHFIDDLFNYSRERLASFCDRMIGSKIGVTWRNLARVELLDDEILEMMKQAGCYKLSLGLESGSERILRYIGKSPDLKRVAATVRRCNDLGIQTKGFFTIGYPIETEDEIKRTIDFAKSLGLTEAYFMVVRALPGTALYEHMKKSGFSERDLDEYTQFQDEDGYVKYHVMNFRALGSTPAEGLDSYIKVAYRDFYSRGANKL